MQKKRTLSLCALKFKIILLILISAIIYWPLPVPVAIVPSRFLGIEGSYSEDSVSSCCIGVLFNMSDPVPPVGKYINCILASATCT